MTRDRWWRWVGLGLVGGLAALFASFNSDERVALELGFTTIYQIPLVPLILTAFVVGMVTMFLLGLRHDLHVRDALREAGFGEPAAPGELTRGDAHWRPGHPARHSVAPLRPEGADERQHASKEPPPEADLPPPPPP